MKHMIIMALLCAFPALAAEAPKPKALSGDTKLKIAQLQLQITQEQMQLERIIGDGKERLKTMEAQYLAAVEAARKEAGVGPECNPNAKQEMVCPAPPPKPEAKK
jgi:hypothetical protein